MNEQERVDLMPGVNDKEEIRSPRDGPHARPEVDSSIGIVA